MLSDSQPQRLTTVLATHDERIHLATVQAVVQPAAEAGGPVTLCDQPITDRIAAQRYHRLGCSECAAEAVARGVMSIEDREHATVNLPRFLAARREHHPGPPPAVPAQRGSQGAIG